jgi:hypothetical protein
LTREGRKPPTLIETLACCNQVVHSLPATSTRHARPRGVPPGDPQRPRGRRATAGLRGLARGARRPPRGVYPRPVPAGTAAPRRPRPPGTVAAGIRVTRRVGAGVGGAADRTSEALRLPAMACASRGTVPTPGAATTCSSPVSVITTIPPSAIPTAASPCKTSSNGSSWQRTAGRGMRCSPSRTSSAAEVMATSTPHARAAHLPGRVE